MIAYDKHHCKIHFLSSVETNSNNNCISHFIPMSLQSEITLNTTQHGSNCNSLLRNFVPH